VLAGNAYGLAGVGASLHLRDMLTRRLVLASGFATALAPSALAVERLRDQAAGIEAGLKGGRLGVTWLGPGGGTWTGHRASERFLMCSTFKAFLVAALLDKVQRNALQLDAMVAISKADLVGYAPVVEPKIPDGEISRLELCRAAVTLSDNAAANLLLHDIGGPAELTRYMRRLGDRITRMDRTEPTLNAPEWPADTRDTSTPLAFVRSLRKVLFGNVLEPQYAAQLLDWLKDTHTGDARIRAGVPTGWDVGDKTGTSIDAVGATNDVAVFKPPGGRVQMLSVFVDAPKLSGAEREAVIADVARAVAAQLA
jgi:beta-lactamase class A